MKISVATLLLASSANAFTAPSRTVSVSALSMTDAPEETISEEPVVVAAPEPVVDPLPTMSQALPFMARPAALDGSMAGDAGFDPLGFAKNSEDLMNYREAEIKHARLAMLAAAGWPLSELWDKKIAALFAIPALVDSSDRAPSLLNGGLGKVPVAYWITCALAAGAIDFYGISKARAGGPDYFPGNLGFDPLGLYPKDEEGQKQMQAKEIRNGRLAMIAITAFAVQEFVSKTGVVDETPLFFKPLGAVLADYANSGYLPAN